MKIADGFRMDTRSGVQWTVAFFFMVAGFGSAVSAGPTFIYGGDFDLPIPAADAPMSKFGKGWMDDAVIEIPDHFTIYDLDVGITLTHTSVFDLQIFLQSPAGTLLCLNMYNLDEFFKGEDYTQTIFDDEADLPIEEGQPPFTGRFRPRSPAQLSVFDGQDIYGPWRLKIYDQWFADTGNLESFEVMITIAEPATATLLMLGVAFVALLKLRWGC
jgi:subtilisin-like proprotein convertase family protein